MLRKVTGELDPEHPRKSTLYERPPAVDMTKSEGAGGLSRRSSIARKAYPTICAVSLVRASGPCARTNAWAA
jgi:hypothetical protein